MIILKQVSEIREGDVLVIKVDDDNATYIGTPVDNISIEKTLEHHLFLKSLGRLPATYPPTEHNGYWISGVNKKLQEHELLMVEIAAPNTSNEVPLGQGRMIGEF